MTRREAIANAAVLAGIGLSIPTLSISLASCQSEPLEKLDVLSTDQAQTLKMLGNLLLPKGSSLGAEDVSLTKLTDILLRDCEATEAKDEMLKTLDYLKAEGVDQDGFSDKLKAIEAEAYQSQTPDPEIMGYRKLKSYVLFAFFTSENVMETMLDYHPIPTKHVGCVPVTESTKVYVDLNV